MNDQFIENSISSDKKSKSSFQIPTTEQQNFDANYDAIIDLVREFRTNAIKQVEKRHVQSALEIIFWPSNENVWEKSEAICMAKVKYILENMFSEDPNVATGLKECLQTILFLGEIRNTNK